MASHPPPPKALLAPRLAKVLLSRPLQAARGLGESRDWQTQKRHGKAAPAPADEDGFEEAPVTPSRGRVHDTSEARPVGWFRGGGQGEAQGQEEGGRARCRSASPRPSGAFHELSRNLPVGGRPVVARLLGGATVAPVRGAAWPFAHLWPPDGTRWSRPASCRAKSTFQSSDRPSRTRHRWRSPSGASRPLLPPPRRRSICGGGGGWGGAAGGAGPRRRRRRGGGATWLAASPGLRSTRARRQGAVGGPGGVGVRPTSPPPSFPPVCCALLKKDRSGAVSVRRRSLVCFVGSGGLFCSEREKNTPGRHSLLLHTALDFLLTAL